MSGVGKLDPVKRQTILNEIEYWRNSRLLPEQYCDFLKNLYTDHDRVETSRRKFVLWRKSLFITGTTSLFLLLLVYFNSFPPLMQTLLALIVVGALHGLGVTYADRPIPANALHGAAALLLLLLGILMLQANEYAAAGYAISLIAICGGIWVGIGWFLHIPLLHLCGWICLLMAELWLIPLIHPQPGWMVLQLYTVPVAALLAAYGNHRRAGRKAGGAVLLIASALFFLGAEGYGIIFAAISGVLLYPMLALKIMLLLLAAWAVGRNPKTPDWLEDHD